MMRRHIQHEIRNLGYRRISARHDNTEKVASIRVASAETGGVPALPATRVLGLGE
jgi:hypothetical protein